MQSHTSVKLQGTPQEPARVLCALKQDDGVWGEVEEGRARSCDRVHPCPAVCWTAWYTGNTPYSRSIRTGRYALFHRVVSTSLFFSRRRTSLKTILPPPYLDTQAFDFRC